MSKFLRICSFLLFGDAIFIYFFLFWSMFWHFSLSLVVCLFCFGYRTKESKFKWMRLKQESAKMNKNKCRSYKSNNYWPILYNLALKSMLIYVMFCTAFSAITMQLWCTHYVLALTVVDVNIRTVNWKKRINIYKIKRSKAKWKDFLKEVLTFPKNEI